MIGRVMDLLSQWNNQIAFVFRSGVKPDQLRRVCLPNDTLDYLSFQGRPEKRNFSRIKRPRDRLTLSSWHVAARGTVAGLFDLHLAHRCTRFCSSEKWVIRRIPH